MTLAIRCSLISLPASVPRFAIPTSWFVGVVKSSSLSPDFASARKPPRSPRAFSPLFPANPSRSRARVFLCTVPSPSVGPLSRGTWIRPSTSTTKKSSPLPTAPSIKPRIPAATRPLALSIPNPPPNLIPPSPTAIPKLASPNSPPPPLTSPPTASKPLPSPDPFSPKPPYAEAAVPGHKELHGLSSAEFAPIPTIFCLERKLCTCAIRSGTFKFSQRSHRTSRRRRWPRGCSRRSSPPRFPRILAFLAQANRASRLGGFSRHRARSARLQHQRQTSRHFLLRAFPSRF